MPTPSMRDCSRSRNRRNPGERRGVNLIASGLSPLRPELAAFAAAQTVIEEIDRMAIARWDFGFETRSAACLTCGESRHGSAPVIESKWCILSCAVRDWRCDALRTDGWLPRSHRTLHGTPGTADCLELGKRTTKSVAAGQRTFDVPKSLPDCGLSAGLTSQAADGLLRVATTERANAALPSKVTPWCGAGTPSPGSCEIFGHEICLRGTRGRNGTGRDNSLRPGMCL